jgi:hypothetical protein
MAGFEPTSAPRPTQLAERAESEPAPEERPYTALFGLPTMIGLLVVIAAWSVSHTVLGVLLAAGGVLLVLLAIGLAMTIAKREEPPASSE